MTNREREPQLSPENGNLLPADPEELMRDNPAALILNKETYNQMAAHFAPSEFDPPQVVKVSTFSAEHGEVTKYFVVDGMTRTKFVNDNKDNPNIIPPDFKFIVRDVTESKLQNPTFVPVEERMDGQQALTMLQYLRAVVPPTIEHSQIAADRIAAHLINGWENMVGTELARKYSALAALSLLGNRSINIATNEGLRRDLSSQERLMGNESIEERVLLQQKLIEMAAVIRQTRLDRVELARTAFMLVGTESPVIGGEREARRQIYGLLHTPELERKLEQAFPSIAEREQGRDQIGKFLSDTFKRISQFPNREEATTAIGEAIRNPQFNFNNALDIFTAPNPIERYREVQQGVNIDRLRRVYVSSHRIKELSSVESLLIEMQGGVMNLSDAEIQGLTSLINSADTIIKRADGFKEQIAQERNVYLESGVTREVLDNANTSIQSAQEAIRNARGPASLRTANNRLIATVEEYQKRISNQVNLHKVTNTVDEKTADSLRTSVRSEIIELVFTEFREVTDRNQKDIETRIQQYASLDNDLFRGVREGDMRLSRALSLQERRNHEKEEQERRSAAAAAPVAPPPTPPAVEVPLTPTTPAEPGVVLPVQLPVESTPSAPVPPTPVQRSPEAIVDPAYLEQQRKEVNREKFRSLAEDTIRALNDIDLDPEDITNIEREGIGQLVRMLGRLGYGWPDAARILREDYSRLLEENRKLREQIVYGQRYDSERDARTDR